MNKVGSHGRSQHWWMVVIILLLVSVGIALALFVQRATTQISEALAEEVLQQQHDVANLLHDYAEVILALERERRNGSKETRHSIELALDKAQVQLQKMRFEYSFERLDGAATAHAYVKPVLDDVAQWLAWGLPGYSADDPVVLRIAAQRLSDRYDKLRLIALETDRVATTLLSAQADNLDRFREFLIYLLGLFALLALGIAVLLMGQRNLQVRLRKNQESFSQRITDFADIGADWFWEMTADLKLNVLSGMALNSDNQLRMDQPPVAEQDSIFAAYNNKVADVHWPIDSLLSRQEFTEFESAWITSAGERHVVAMSGKPLFGADGDFVGYRGIGRDITKRRDTELELEAVYLELIQAQTVERQQAEEALRDSEQFLSISLDAMAPGIAILDEKGIIRVTNQAWKGLSDGNVSGGVGVHYLDAFLTCSEAEMNSFSTASDSIDEVLSGRLPSLHYEFQYQLPDQLRWMVINLTTFRSNGLKYAVLVYEDITDRRNLEDQDRKLRADLAHVARLTTAGEMATLLAHELNQPLTAISHNSDALLSTVLRSEGASPEVVETVSDIYKQSQRAGGIIHSMRQMVRKDTHTTSSININQLVKDTVRLTHPEAREHNVDVHLQLAENLPNLIIDPVQIQQVLVNLERNGVEAIRNSGFEVRQLYIISSQDDVDTIRITVQDTGLGIDRDVEDKLFKSFHTTKVDGMGMGLSISRSIVEAHGGRLWLGGTESGLTSFHFTLPVI